MRVCSLARSSLVLLAFLLGGAGQTVAGQDPRSGPSVRPRENYYAAGHRLELTAPVDGDAVVAGRHITLGQPIAGDVLAAGWTVALSARASDDVRVIGQEVSVTAPVEGDLTAAAADLRVGPPAQVSGRTWLTGDTVRLEGVFEREVRIAAREVTLGGEVRQPILVVAESLTILPTANLLADVTYRGPTAADVRPGARLAAPLRYEQIPAADARRERTPRSASFVLFLLHISVAGLLFLWLVPRLSTDSAATLRAQPGLSALIGFVLLVTMPIAALLFMVSLVGLPVGLALVAVYLVALLLGLLVAAYAVGELEWRLWKHTAVATRGQQALAVVAGALTLALLRLFPIVGGLTVFLAVLFGLGSLGLWTYRRWTAAWHAAPTPV